jgi:quercetin dioxygenase-like cupin family protein
MKSKRIVIIGLATLGLFAGVAYATSGAGVSASTPVRGTIGEPVKVEIDDVVELKTKSAIDVVDQNITIQPAGHTGWHSHAGPGLIVIQSGTLTFYDGDDPSCTGVVYTAGQTFVDKGGGHAHLARNEGAVPVALTVTYLLPAGAPTRIDVADPGNCDFSPAG